MRGSRTFRANVFKTTAGRWRWVVEIAGTGDVLGAGYAPNQVSARREAREIQHRQAHNFKNQIVTR